MRWHSRASLAGRLGSVTAASLKVVGNQRISAVEPLDVNPTGVRESSHATDPHLPREPRARCCRGRGVGRRPGVARPRSGAHRGRGVRRPLRQSVRRRRRTRVPRRSPVRRRGPARHARPGVGVGPGAARLGRPRDAEHPGQARVPALRRGREVDALGDGIARHHRDGRDRRQQLDHGPARDHGGRPAPPRPTPRTSPTDGWAPSCRPGGPRAGGSRWRWRGCRSPATGACVRWTRRDSTPSGRSLPRTRLGGRSCHGRRARPAGRPAPAARLGRGADRTAIGGPWRRCPRWAGRPWSASG